MANVDDKREAGALDPRACVSGDYLFGMILWQLIGSCGAS